MHNEMLRRFRTTNVAAKSH